jgi:hypothetical protein
MRGLARFDLQADVSAGTALDQGGRRFGIDADQALGTHADDQFAGLQAGARGRRGVEHAPDQQAALLRVDHDPDAREVRRRVEFAEFEGGQVVREAIAEAGHGSGNRAVGQLARGDRPVVVVGDPVDRFADDARLGVLDERPANERRQVFGMAAQIQAGHQQDRQQGGQHGHQRRSARRRARHRVGLA